MGANKQRAIGNLKPSFPTRVTQLSIEIYIRYTWEYDGEKHKFIIASVTTLLPGARQAKPVVYVLLTLIKVLYHSTVPSQPYLSMFVLVASQFFTLTALAI